MVASLCALLKMGESTPLPFFNLSAYTKMKRHKSNRTEWLRDFRSLTSTSLHTHTCSNNPFIPSNSLSLHPKQANIFKDAQVSLDPFDYQATARTTKCRILVNNFHFGKSSLSVLALKTTLKFENCPIQIRKLFVKMKIFRKSTKNKQTFRL